METGEIVDSSSPQSKKLRTTSITKYVGIETKWPTQCLTVDHLMESLGQLDGYVHHKPIVQYELLNQHMIQGMISQNEWTLLHWLCQHLHGWNYWIGDVDMLQAVLGAKVQARRTMASLIDKGLVRVLHKDKPQRGCRVLLVNPTLAWKGAYLFQNNAVQRWYV